MEKITAFLARWFAQPDKFLHAAVGMLAFVIVSLAGETWANSLPTALRVVLALCAVSLAAWGKERYDKAHPQTHTWDGWDAYATTVGGMLGSLFWVLV